MSSARPPSTATASGSPGKLDSAVSVPGRSRSAPGPATAGARRRWWSRRTLPPSIRSSSRAPQHADHGPPGDPRVAARIFWLLSGRSLHSRHRQALERATLDGLTDLGNHRAFQDELRRAGALASRYGLSTSRSPSSTSTTSSSSTTAAATPHGDDVLRRVAQVLARGRAPDRAFRIGGDEFALLMPAPTSARRAVPLRAASAAWLRQADRRQLRRQRDPAGHARRRVLREEADAALYEGKRSPLRGADLATPRSATNPSLLTPEKAHGLAAPDQGRRDGRRAPADLGPRQQDARGPRGARAPALRLRAQRPGRGVRRRRADRAHRRARPAVRHAASSSAAWSSRRAPACSSTCTRPASGTPVSTGSSKPSAADGLLPEQVVVEVTERSGARATGRRPRRRAPARARPAGRPRRRRRRQLRPRDAALRAGRLRQGRPRHRVSAPRPRRSPARSWRRSSPSPTRPATYVIAEGIEDAGLLAFLRGLEVRTTTGIRGGQGYGLGRPAPTVAAAIAGGAALNAEPAPEPAPEPAFVATTLRGCRGRRARPARAASGPRCSGRSAA